MDTIKEFVRILNTGVFDDFSKLLYSVGRTTAIVDVLKERRYQDQVWGGSSHDYEETEDNWVKYINEYANVSSYNFRKKMVKIAAIALVAIESYDRRQENVSSSA